EANFKNIKQNNHLQTSFTAGNAMRPRQRMRTLRTNRREGKGFLKIRSDFVFTPLVLAPGALQPGDLWQKPRLDYSFLRLAAHEKTQPCAKKHPEWHHFRPRHDGNKHPSDELRR
ncbi:hypothetical protein, partial [Cobetia sp. BMC6]